jgi:hypothetical protein
MMSSHVHIRPSSDSALMTCIQTSHLSGQQPIEVMAARGQAVPLSCFESDSHNEMSE